MLQYYIILSNVSLRLFEFLFLVVYTLSCFPVLRKNETNKNKFCDYVMYGFGRGFRFKKKKKTKKDKGRKIFIM
jgi:hypothetical protein